MTIEVWDRQPLGDQEAFIGRTKDTGAPLSGGEEFDQPDFDMPGSNEPPVVSRRRPRPAWSTRTSTAASGCCAAATTSSTAATRIGGLDAGLFFLAFVRNPDTHFIPIQTKMAANDALMEYLKVNGSALFAVPPGHRRGRVRRAGALLLACQRPGDDSWPLRRSALT